VIHRQRPQTGSARPAVLLATAVAVALVAVVAGVVTLRGRVGEEAAAASQTAPAASHRAPAALPPVTVDLSPQQRGSTPDPASEVSDRTRAVSRSEDRSAVDARKKPYIRKTPGRQVTRTAHRTPTRTAHRTPTRTARRTPKNPRAIARLLLARYGFSARQFPCLNAIYVNESGWKVHADNPSSSAYGIPQALPGSKMASAGPDWHDNPATQIRWGLGYIKARYGSPCGAWSFKQGHGWY
jgi:hypothetical protein